MGNNLNYGGTGKWLLLQKRKSALQLYYNKRFEEESRRIDDETRLALNRQLFKSIDDALMNAKSEREADDVDAKFNLHFPPGEVETDSGQFKRPKRKSVYSTCSKAGLWEVANKFSINAEKFGLFLALEEVRREDLEDAKETPEEIAANFTCQMFGTPQDVLKGARHMVAVEIGCLRVLACCWGLGKPATTFVLLDSAGEMVDLLYAGSLSLRGHDVAEQQRKKNDQRRVLKFVTDHQPQVVCLGGATLSCRQLKDELYEIFFKIVEDHPKEVTQDIHITIVDESLPRLYENSRVSSDQLPGQSGSPMLCLIENQQRLRFMECMEFLPMF